MGIKALQLTSAEPYVSELDPGKNAKLVNEAEIQTWKNSKAKGKGDCPEAVYEHAPEATRWLLGTLDSMTMSILVDELTSIGDSGGLSLRNAENDVTAARLGLRGWENFFDEDGQPVEFRTQTIFLRGRRVEALADDLVGVVPIPVLREIGQQVKQRNSLNAVKAKNSDSASSR